MSKKQGHHDELKRDLGLPSAAILVIANMIGTGIFTTSGFIIEALGDPKVMLMCWAVGGILALCGALCYGELGAKFPKAGGEYVFLRESFGKAMGFLSGWISLIVGFSAPIAAASIAFSGYLFRSLAGVLENPGAALFETGPISISPMTLVAITIIIVFSLVHFTSLHFGSRVQNVLTLFKLGVIISFIVGGLGFGRGSMNHFASEFDFGLLFSGEFATSLIFVSFAYSGWNAAAYLGAEIRNPSRNIPLALLCGTLLVAVLYLLLNVVFIYALPVEGMGGVLEVGAKSATTLFGARIGGLFSIAVTVCLLSVISAMIMAGPRVYYAMARDGVFFERFGKVAGSHGTPGASIFLQAGIATLMVITSSFDKLLIYIGFTLSMFAVFTVAGMMVLRMQDSSGEVPYRTFGYPVTPILFIVSNLWIIVFSIKSNPVVALYGGVTIVAGIGVYLYFNRRGPLGDTFRPGLASLRAPGTQGFSEKEIDTPGRGC
jgi:APA family basic amino acid/polyamine antiporter